VGVGVTRAVGPLLERQAELQAIAEALGAARAAEGSIVMIDAAPGLGKTRLIEEALDASRGLQMQALTAVGREPEREFAFGVTLQLFGGRLAAAPEASRERLLFGPARPARPVLEAGARDGDAGNFGYLHGLYWLATHLAGERPLLLAIDDAQWSDHASLRFLLYLAQRVARLPLAIVVAAGRGDARQRDPLFDELSAHPSTTVVRPRPLSPDAVAALLRASRFPDAADAFAEACHEVTGGNPFLLEELASDLVRRGVPPDDENAPAVLELGPGSITARVLVRLRRLGEGPLELARAVAVLGDGAELRHATELSGIGAGLAAGAADTLMAAGVLEGDDPLRFTQPIVRVALNEERTELERADAHRRAAQLLLDEDAPADRVATQLLDARRDADPRAVEVLSEAARDAIAAGAPGWAVRLLRRALEEPPTPEQRAKVLLALGRAEATAGEAEAVERLTGAVGLMSDPAQRAAAALDAGRMLVTHGRWSDASDTLSRGLEQLAGAQGPLRARLESARAAVNGLAFGPVAQQPAVGLDDPLLAKTLVGRARLAYAAAERAMRGEPAVTVRELAVRALGNGSLLDEETSDGLSYYLAVWALTLAEDIQTAELALTAAIEDARRRGSVLGFATACLYRSMAVLRRGRVDDAAADAGNALAARRHGWGLSTAAASGTLVECHIERGDSEAAMRELAAREEEPGGVDPGTYQFVASRGRLRLVLARHREALDDLLESGRLQAKLGWHNPSMYPWRSLAAAAAMQLGDRERARELVEEELALATSFGAPGAVSQALHGVAAVVEGAAAVEVREEAVRVLEGSQSALRRARASVELGAALRRAGNLRDAREALRQGLDLAHRCGARALAARAREELVAAGGRPRRQATTGIDALTPRERQVAGLAAQGMSNREIAEALFVTLKTVEWHLSRAYEKVGVQSRRELGAALAGRKSG
jgi:DNA-binding CsgD family transcriptional regulator